MTDSLIEFTATTHPGNRYQHNEDAIGWSEPAGIWFVADGIGGHARGDLASATVKKALLEAPLAPQRTLKELVMLAHKAVLLEGIEQAHTNMGSTLVLARILRGRLNVAWCGDSRAYLWRKGKLNRLTRDHSLLEQMLDSGVITPEEAFGHPRRNVLVQALGIDEPPPKPSEISLPLDNDDVLLLCSDGLHGLHDELPDNQIEEVLTAMCSSTAVSTQAIVDELERRVLATDARDNLSVICLHVSGLSRIQAKPAQLVERSDETPTVQRSLAATQPRGVRTQRLSVDTVEIDDNQPLSQSDSSLPWLAIIAIGLLLALGLFFV